MRIDEIADPRTQQQSSLTLPKVIRALEENCSNAIQAMKENKFIYKGFNTNLGHNFLLTDPSQKERKSANTSNQYTLLMDNLPAWKEYPKRSRSLVCSTSSDRAASYGNVYLVLPFNGARIGICPEYDIWDSFYELSGYGIADADDFATILHK